MIILDFMKTERTINGKTVKSPCIIHTIEEPRNNRECLICPNMKELRNLYHLQGSDSSLFKKTIGCNYWHKGINCLLDPACTKKELRTEEKEINILFHTESNTHPKVTILIKVPTKIIEQQYSNKSVRNATISKLFMKQMSPEIQEIYEEYLRRENAK